MHFNESRGGKAEEEGQRAVADLTLAKKSLSSRQWRDEQNILHQASLPSLQGILEVGSSPPWFSQSN